MGRSVQLAALAGSDLAISRTWNCRCGAGGFSDVDLARLL